MTADDKWRETHMKPTEFSAKEMDELRRIFPKHNESTLRTLPAAFVRRQIAAGKELAAKRREHRARMKALCAPPGPIEEALEQARKAGQFRGA